MGGAERQKCEEGLAERIIVFEIPQESVGVERGRIKTGVWVALVVGYAALLTTDITSAIEIYSTHGVYRAPSSQYKGGEWPGTNLPGLMPPTSLSHRGSHPKWFAHPGSIANELPKLVREHCADTNRSNPL